MDLSFTGTGDVQGQEEQAFMKLYELDLSDRYANPPSFFELHSVPSSTPIRPKCEDSYKRLRHEDNSVGSKSDDSGYLSDSFSRGLSPVKRNSSHFLDWDGHAQKPKRLFFSCVDEDFSSSETTENSRIKDFSDLSMQNRSGTVKKHVDFVSALLNYNCDILVSQIFSYLQPADLSSIKCVNKQWREAVIHDRKANERLNRFIKKICKARTGSVKENLHKKKISIQHSGYLLDIQNIILDEKPTPVLSLQDSTEAEVKAGTLLQTCPRCRSPAAIHSSMARCTGTQCLYEFCSHCLQPCEEQHSCSYVLDRQVPKLAVCTKKSRRNLRRL